MDQERQDISALFPGIAAQMRSAFLMRPSFAFLLSSDIFFTASYI